MPFGCSTLASFVALCLFCNIHLFVQHPVVLHSDVQPVRTMHMQLRGCCKGLEYSWLSCLPQIEAGVQDVSPGQATEEFLTKKMRHCRFWGGLLVAFLAVGAHYFDLLCKITIGTSLGSMTLLLIVGVITAAIRQVQLHLECL